MIVTIKANIKTTNAVAINNATKRDEALIGGEDY